MAPGQPADVTTVRAMRGALAHRGPDGEGEYSGDGVALGHTRLAILDLSDAGLQPMTSEDGALSLVHNGEIYNYRELRIELEQRGHRFRTATDTEVILAAYREWDDECVRRFNGMWAFAIWDAPRRRLFCSRDRFGIKPFFYSLRGGRLAFASELKAFRAEPESRLEPNLCAVADYLYLGDVDHDDEAFIAGVQKLPAASCLAFDDNGLRVWTYWRLEPKEPPAGDYADTVRAVFLDALRLHLRSDVHVGTCLSGGLDSSAIVCGVDYLLRTEVESALPVGERQKTFTAWFTEAAFDERRYAEAVTERTLAEPHWITFSDRELVDALPAVVHAQDEPFGSTSIVAQWFVMREARRAGVKVMLDGQGADEIFAGYHDYFSSHFADLLLRGSFRELRAEVASYRALHEVGLGAATVALARPFVPNLIKPLVRGRITGAAALMNQNLRSLAHSSEEDRSLFPDRFRRHLELLLLRRGLPALLRYEDRNSMAHSLEARVPFLDYRLVELLFALPAAQRIHRGWTKNVLRRALHDLLPPPVRDRADKLGFGTPEGIWLRGQLGVLANDVFASQSFRERGWLDAPAVRARLARHRRGEIDAGFELWRALNVELWAQAALDR